MEIRGTFFDMSGEVYEVVVDERRGFVVVVRFGFQPSACASSRSGAEVDEQWFLVRFRFAECSVCVFEPVNFHFFSPLSKHNYGADTLYVRAPAPWLQNDELVTMRCCACRRRLSAGLVNFDDGAHPRMNAALKQVRANRKI